MLDVIRPQVPGESMRRVVRDLWGILCVMIAFEHHMRGTVHFSVQAWQSWQAAQPKSRPKLVAPL